MAQKSNVFKEKLKHKGYWNFSELYNYCFNWLKDEGYSVSESEYTEKLSSFGKEIQIKWEAKKKVTDYYRNVIKVEWHVLGMKDAEIERDGKKESTNKGEIKISIGADLETDYEEKWEAKPFWKFMRGVYDKYIIRTTTDEYEDRLGGQAESYVKDVKAFLQVSGM